MNDEQSIQQSVNAFYSLSGDDASKLRELNTRIQKNRSVWGIKRGGEQTVDGAIEMQWVDKNPLIYEFLEFMDDNGLLPIFAWAAWKEGSDLFESDDPSKYDSIDTVIILKLIYAATRKDRFGDGTLVWAFESGDFVKLIDRLEKKIKE